MTATRPRPGRVRDGRPDTDPTMTAAATRRTHSGIPVNAVQSTFIAWIGHDRTNARSLPPASAIRSLVLVATRCPVVRLGPPVTADPRGRRADR